MNEISRRRVKKAVEKGLLLLGLLGLMTVPGSSQTASSAIVPKRLIVVSIPDRKLAILEDGRIRKIYRVSVGAAVSPSPTGEFQVVTRILNPTYYHPGVVIPAGENSPIGTRWIGLNKKGYGIHGTNEPHSIGRAASHGCIRMRNREVEEFFKLVRAGDTVQIRGERDAQTAEIFGARPTMLADVSSGNQGAIGQ